MHSQFSSSFAFFSTFDEWKNVLRYLARQFVNYRFQMDQVGQTDQTDELVLKFFRSSKSESFFLSLSKKNRFIQAHTIYSIAVWIIHRVLLFRLVAGLAGRGDDKNKYHFPEPRLSSRNCWSFASRRFIRKTGRDPASGSQVKGGECALILLRADRAYISRRIAPRRATGNKTGVEKNGPFGNALDTEIDDTIHFEISPAQLPPSQVRTGIGTGQGKLWRGVVTAGHFVPAFAPLFAIVTANKYCSCAGARFDGGLAPVKYDTWVTRAALWH